MFGWFKKALESIIGTDKTPLVSSIYTKYEPAPDYSKAPYIPTVQGKELVIGWPLNFGVAWRIEGDARDDIGCNACFFSQMDAELFCDALRFRNPNSRTYYQVVKFPFDNINR
jgi:hypothetical protein